MLALHCVCCDNCDQVKLKERGRERKLDIGQVKVVKAIASTKFLDIVHAMLQTITHKALTLESLQSLTTGTGVSV